MTTTPRVINDRLSVGQLQEQIKKFVKQEIRRRDGAISDAIPDAGVTQRFVQPYRIAVNTATDISLNSAVLVAFYLMAGSKSLHVKRIFADMGEHKAAATGSNAHRLQLRRWAFPPILQLATIGSASFVACRPVCMTDSKQMSTAVAAVSSGTSLITSTAQFTGADQSDPFGIIGIPNCNTGAFRRFPTVLDWSNKNDTDLFVIPPMTGIWIEGLDSATGSLWPAGFIEWVE